MEYLCFNCHIPDATDPEIVLAYLAELPFETFETEDALVKAYIPSNVVDENFYELLANIEKQFRLKITKTQIPDQNWNELWESNFQPIRIGDFVQIRANFHKPEAGVEHDIIIHPKMAFGTGHHATTCLVIESMEQLNFQNAKVLDFGCGTGVLAILALRLGAASVHAVDIEEPAYENTLENIALNGGGNALVFHCGLEQISEGDFDIILANINRNVILEMLGTLYDKLSPDGYLLISGFLESDETTMVKAIKAYNFSTPLISRKNNWLCMTLQRN